MTYGLVGSLINGEFTFPVPNKDKYYVADLDNTSYLVRKYNGSLYIVWATGNESLSSSNIDVLSSANSNVGTGKRNTNYIRNSKYNSTYYPKTVGNSSNRITPWDCAIQANNANANGCNDWYVPSIGELTHLRNNSGLTLQQWYDKVIYKRNSVSYVLSSSAAYSGSSNAWYWRAFPTYSFDCADYYTRSSAFNAAACVLVRSF